eukprot:TRINITY_DN2399_c0_g1_i1.p1 TRINITY_DN2399_c0_g1~~TRINITY_DN2399_c0_g1_i1.p1  ORF type:complete len:236 (+),score=50.74 TRINITY_DN2399_c0_g1_i1:98-805(+)
MRRRGDSYSGSDSDSDSDTDSECPLCMAPLDDTDRAFKPCKCNYQMCLLCFKQLAETSRASCEAPRCPNCRTPYDENNYVIETVTTKTTHPKPKKTSKAVDRKKLTDVRVIQKNLVYVANLSAKVAAEPLGSSEFFGQFGSIHKHVLNKNPSYFGADKGTSSCIYITFVHDKDAQACIDAVNGAWVDGRLLRATHGTTKIQATLVQIKEHRHAFTSLLFMIRMLKLALMLSMELG